MTHSQSRQILSTLLAEAGICQKVQSIGPINEMGLTNLMSLVKFKDGSCYVLREYRWPYEGTDFFDRMRKETLRGISFV